MWSWAGAALIAMAAAASIASAQQTEAVARIAVAGAGPDGCLRAGPLRESVERWLSRSPRMRDRRDALAALEVEVDADADPVTVTVRRGGRAVAERRFDVLPERCEDRIDAVSLAIALALEHLAVGSAGPAAEATGGARATAPAGESQPDAAARASGETAVPAAPIRSQERRPSPEPKAAEDAAAAEARVRIHAGGALLAGVLPQPAPAFGAGADVVLGPVQLSITLLATPKQDGRLGIGWTETQLFAAHARGCALLPAAPLELEGCAGLAGGAAFASGSGYATSMDATMGWLAPVLRVALRYPRDEAVSLRLALDGAVNALRPKLVLEGATPSSTGDVLAGAAGLELSVGLP